MKRILIAASIAAALSLGACSTAQQAVATKDLAWLQAQVVNGCTVVQPTLESIAALDPAVTAAATANGLVCASASTIQVTSIMSLVTTGIPAIESAVNQSTLIQASQKPLVIAALGVFQLTLTNALSIYGQAASTSTAATTQ